LFYVGIDGNLAASLTLGSTWAPALVLFFFLFLSSEFWFLEFHEESRFINSPSSEGFSEGVAEFIVH